jgi:dihydroorotase
MREEKFAPGDVVRVAAANPGAFLRPFLSPRDGRGFGRIEPGYVGSLAVIDPTRPWTVARSGLKTKCGWSPFEGVTFPGSVRATVIRGTVHTVS